MFIYAHVKWFYGQSERAYYLNYFINMYIYIYVRPFSKTLQLENVHEISETCVLIKNTLVCKFVYISYVYLFNMYIYIYIGSLQVDFRLEQCSIR